MIQKKILQCKHDISTVDCQPSGPASGMLVFVSGNLQLAGEEHALKFSQVCVLTLYPMSWITESAASHLVPAKLKAPLLAMLRSSWACNALK
ncbi:hypothetical protein ARALYDRAFT_893740 [Arabidopsis lyrata subsp. lyrata]|uniref:NTF2 domain-containing protein n=1 Tax=Arabidopsis lyrata subsp. lyrata TaxID=81972 RepID=D7KYL6_ARALL|nr:hypothetical protein ARALYDRAFT_893740 [Arabidopsis lyrata subsp. lyrata]